MGHIYAKQSYSAQCSDIPWRHSLCLYNSAGHSIVSQYCRLSLGKPPSDWYSIWLGTRHGQSYSRDSNRPPPGNFPTAVELWTRQLSPSPPARWDGGWRRCASRRNGCSRWRCNCRLVSSPPCESTCSNEQQRRFGGAQLAWSNTHHSLNSVLFVKYLCMIYLVLLVNQLYCALKCKIRQV